VLDLTEGIAGPLATMTLADFGAEVIRVEPPGGDPGWEEPAYLLLNRGKKSINLDIASAEGQGTVRRLTPGFDVVIESLGAGRADAAGIGYASLSGLNPGLVYCSITPFGPTGPFAHVQGDDGVVMAKAGIFKDQIGWFQEHGDGRRPVYRAPKDCSYFAAMFAVQGVLAALLVRDATGRGQLVETNMLQALTWRLNPAVGWLLRNGEELPANPVLESWDPRQSALAGTAECKDGRWLTHALAQPHFFPAWIKAIDFEWIWDDDRFKGAPYKFANPEDRAELIRLTQARLAEKTAAEWMEIYLANGNVCVDVVETTQEALRHPQVVEGDYLVEVDDPRVGRIVQVGPLAKIPAAPATVGAPAPRPGEHTEEVLSAKVEPVTLPAPGRMSPKSPLEGITIIEAAYYAATPFGIAHLAELGARVIKIEPLIGDPYRRIGAAAGTTGDAVRGLGLNNMCRAMQGKESIVVNLKDERGQEILRRLVSEADVFVHNFRPGVPESLGIDEATLRKINPTLLYQYGASYGSTGPYSAQPAIDSVIAAFSGHTAFQAGEGNPPITEAGADPVAAAGFAASLLIGLYARQRTGQGLYVESAMIQSNLFANCDDALSYDGKPPRAQVDHLQLGIGATWRLYETAPGGVDHCRWVFLALSRDEEFIRFCEVAGRPDLLADPSFATKAARQENRQALETILDEVFASRTAEQWETSLLAVEVGCVRADVMSNFEFLYNDPQAQAIGMMTTAEHPTFGGTYRRHAPVIRFSETPGLAPPFCEMGEHTRKILAELGYQESEMVALKDAEVVAWPADLTEAAAAVP
jgi:crotonobetainyl-CoA:carnitine CoA-transferase CaiB-like acyl-CoA transferase